VLPIMIVLQFDRGYHPWAVLLLRSLAWFEPDQRVLCDTVGLDQTELDELYSEHPRTICINSPRPSKILRADMANRKPFVLKSAMDTYPDEPFFCLLDADMLVRRPLDDLWRSIEHAASAALVFTDGIWEGEFYARLVTLSSVVLVRRDGRDLIDRWARWYDHDSPVDQITPREWFWDQVTLFLAWCESRLHVAALPLEQYVNTYLDPDAAIWAAIGTDKEGYFQYFEAECDRQGEEVAECMQR
jgi:hypothetical protein